MHLYNEILLNIYIYSYSSLFYLFFFVNFILTFIFNTKTVISSTLYKIKVTQIYLDEGTSIINYSILFYLRK